MTQQGEKTKAKPGTRLMTAGVVAVVYGLVILVTNLASTHSTFVAGVGFVEAHGSVSPGPVLVILAGLALVGYGYRRRMLAARR